MLRNLLTQAELDALNSNLAGPAENENEQPPPSDQEAESLLRLLLRNQLRLIQSIEELRDEILKLRKALETGTSGRETAVGAEPLPLPFMKPPKPRGVEGDSLAEPDAGSALPEQSRKERFKRKSFWSFS